MPGVTAPAPSPTAPVRAAIPLDGRYVFAGSDAGAAACGMTLEPDEGFTPKDVALTASCIQYYPFLAMLDGWVDSPVGGVRLVANGGGVIGDFRRQPNGSYAALVGASGKMFALTPMGMWRGAPPR